MHNTSQIFMLLLNVYFNLGMINPYLNRSELMKLSNVTSEVFGLTLPVKESPEQKVDTLLQEYVNKLISIKNIRDEQKAMEAMQHARQVFMQRATELKPQLEAWMYGLSEQEALQFKEKLMLKPYFKSINDTVLSYKLSSKFESNPQYIQSLEGMGDFLTVLYN